MITIEETKKVANMARIYLTEEEVVKYQSELNTVLAYVDELKNLNTDNLPEVSEVTGLFNIMRDGQVHKSENIEAIKSIAPMMKNDLYQVRSIL